MSKSTVLMLFGFAMVGFGTFNVIRMFKTNTWLGYGGAVRVHRENHPKAFWFNVVFFMLWGICGAALFGYEFLKFFWA